MMKWRAGLAGLMAVLLLGGCGGGGGDSKTGIPSDNPAEEVLEQERKMNNFMVFENTSHVMDYFSTLYRDPKGRSRQDMREVAREVFTEVDILRIDALDPELDPKFRDDGSGEGTQADDPIKTNPDGTLVSQRVLTHIVLRDRGTGEQHSILIRGVYLWANEEGVWRIIGTEEGALNNIRAYINNEPVSIIPEDTLVR